MQNNKIFSVDIEIKLYKHCYYSNNEYKYIGFIASESYIITIKSFCITSAILKAKKWLIDKYRGDYFVEFIKFEAYEEDTLSVFKREE